MEKCCIYGKLLHLTILGIAVTARGVCADAPPVTVSDAWKEAAKLQSEEAQTDFVMLQKTYSREAEYGEAMTLLQAQPKSESNIQAAIDRLHDVIKDGDHDDLGLASQYYLARIEESHHPDVGYDTIDDRFHNAEKLYHQLFTDHPGTLWSELAITRYAELLFYQSEPLEKKKERLAEIEGLTPQLKTPWVLSVFHLNISNAYARFEISDEKALEHLTMAVELGIPQRQTLADALVRIIHWGQMQGKADIVSHYGDIFLRDFQRDDRSYEIKLLVKGGVVTKS